MQLTIEIERETDGRWIAEVLELPGALVYGATEAEARARAQALALRVLAQRPVGSCLKAVGQQASLVGHAMADD